MKVDIHDKVTGELLFCASSVQEASKFTGVKQDRIYRRNRDMHQLLNTWFSFHDKGAGFTRYFSKSKQVAATDGRRLYLGESVEDIAEYIGVTKEHLMKRLNSDGSPLLRGTWKVKYVDSSVMMLMEKIPAQRIKPWQG